MKATVVSPAELSQLIKLSNEGDLVARDQAVNLIYKELHRMARRYRREGETLRPTALVNETFLKLFDRETHYQNRKQLMAHAVLAMRQIVLHKAERAKAQKRGGAERAVTLQDWDGADCVEADYLALNQALEELERIEPRYAQILMMTYFAGFKHQEIAEMLEIAERTVYRDLKLAKAWLKKRLHPAGASQVAQPKSVLRKPLSHEF